jgi:hypothetical protein
VGRLQTKEAIIEFVTRGGMRRVGYDFVERQEDLGVLGHMFRSGAEKWVLQRLHALQAADALRAIVEELPEGEIRSVAQRYLDQLTSEPA